MKYKKNKGRRMPVNISTASMPDIIFMLLFFFMVTTTIQPAQVKEMSLPEVAGFRQFKSNESNLLHITLTKDKCNAEYLWVNGQMVAFKNLESFLYKLSKSGQPFEKVVLWIDNEIQLGSVNSVKKALQKAELSDIEYVHNQSHL